MFFSFDGVDGAGKSTQVALFCEWLRQQGRQVVSCRDPGGTPLGERIRELLLANAALLTHADGEQSASEQALLDKLIGLLEFSDVEAKQILESVQDGALTLSNKVLE